MQILLAGTAIEKNIFDQVSADMELVAEAMDKSPELKRALKNPVIKPEMKSRILEEIFKIKN